MANGKQKGCKKILVLYTNFGKNRKPEKTNWVMHQYHLGQHEEEREGELVVSKIFYQTQPRQCNWTERSSNTTAGEACSTDPNSRRDSGSGSCSSSKEINTMNPHRDELSAAVGAAMSSYNTINIQPLKADHFSFLPYRKNFDEAGIVVADVSTPAGTCEESLNQHTHHMNHEPPQQHQHQHQHHHHQIAGASFHISRPSPPISTILAPPPLHRTSVILDHDPYHVPRIIIPDDNFQQHQQQQQQHHKLGGRSASGLEELIMGCTSSDIKEESSLTNPQETDWLKYSTFWPDPDNTDHHD